MVYSDIDWTIMGPGEDLTGVCRAIEKLYINGLELVLVTAKSIYEVVNLAEKICMPLNRLIAVVESGGAIYTGRRLLTTITGSKTINGVDLEYLQLGQPIPEFWHEVEDLISRLHCRVSRLTGADAVRASEITLLRQESARYASMREYLEVLWSPDQQCLDRLGGMLAEMGFYIHRSARLLHIGMHKGKGVAVDVFRRRSILGGGASIGLGDSEADKDYLEHMDHAIVIPTPDMRLRVRLNRVDYLIPPYPAPRGWVYSIDVILGMLR